MSKLAVYNLHYTSTNKEEWDENGAGARVDDGNDGPGSISDIGNQLFFQSKKSRSDLGTTQPHIKGWWEFFPPRIKRPSRKAFHSPPCTAQFGNASTAELNCCFPRPPTWRAPEQLHLCLGPSSTVFQTPGMAYSCVISNDGFSIFLQSI